MREKAGGKKRKALMVLCEKAEPERAKQAKRKTKRGCQRRTELAQRRRLPPHHVDAAAEPVLLGGGDRVPLASFARS